MISATISLTEAGPGVSALMASAVADGSPCRVSRSHRIEPLQQPVDRWRLQLVRDGVGDQSRGAARDLLSHHQSVLTQRRAAGREVDDALDQAGQRRQLDRPLDLDDLSLAAGREE